VHLVEHTEGQQVALVDTALQAAHIEGNLVEPFLPVYQVPVVLGKVGQLEQYSFRLGQDNTHHFAAGVDFQVEMAAAVVVVAAAVEDMTDMSD